MHVSRNDIPTRIDVPGAKARQRMDFGDAGGCGVLAAEYFSLARGTDVSPLLKGLEDDLCQSPHWGYLVEGEVVVTYHGGEQETVRGGDVFYWPAGHTVAAVEDSEIILFSPQDVHGPVVEHIQSMLKQ